MIFERVQRDFVQSSDIYQNSTNADVKEVVCYFGDNLRRYWIESVRSYRYRSSDIINNFLFGLPVDMGNERGD